MGSRACEKLAEFGKFCTLAADVGRNQGGGGGGGGRIRGGKELD